MYNQQSKNININIDKNHMWCLHTGDGATLSLVNFKTLRRYGSYGNNG